MWRSAPWRAYPVRLGILALLLSSMSACTSTRSGGCSGTPAASSPTVGNEGGPSIEFQTDEPAPSVSTTHQHVVVVVRVINNDNVAYSFCAKAIMVDQQGAVVTSGTTLTKLAANDGKLVRIDASNPNDRPVFSVRFEALGLRETR